MDDADRAARFQQEEIDAAVSRRKEVPSIRPNGGCHECFAPVGPKQIFCDSDCEKEWRKWKQREVAHGK